LFARLAEAYGVLGLTVEQALDVDDAISTANDHVGPVVLDFRVEREANVFPIVPQGRSINEMKVTAELEIFG
jgi:acetolactate synthase-1/2/3 large subunit